MSTEKSGSAKLPSPEPPDFKSCVAFLPITEQIWLMTVVAVVADYFNINIEQRDGTDKTPRLNEARQTAMYLSGRPADVTG